MAGMTIRVGAVPVTDGVTVAADGVAVLLLEDAESSGKTSGVGATVDVGVDVGMADAGIGDGDAVVVGRWVGVSVGVVDAIAVWVGVGDSVAVGSGVSVGSEVDVAGVIAG